MMGDPNQLRGYWTATIPQSEKYFRKSSVLFQDGQEHKDTRLLFQKVAFAASYPVDLDQVRNINETATADSDVKRIVERVLIPVVMKALLGAAPPPEVANPYLADYVKYGGLGIFGETVDLVLSQVGISAK